MNGAPGTHAPIAATAAASPTGVAWQRRRRRAPPECRRPPIATSSSFPTMRDEFRFSVRMSTCTAILWFHGPVAH